MSSEPLHTQDSIADQIEQLKRQKLSGNWVAVGKARRILFWIAVLLFIDEMMAMQQRYREFDTGMFMIVLLETSVFIALGIWTKRKPYTAVLTGLIIFVVMIIVSIYNGAEAAPRGTLQLSISSVLIRLIIFVTLIKAVNDARELQNANRRE